MNKYKLMQDIKHPNGCVDKGTVSISIGEYYFFVYNEFKYEHFNRIELGKGYYIIGDNIDECFPEWFEKIQ